jgi:hypothetical protein
MIAGREEQIEKWESAGFTCRVLRVEDGSFAVELRRAPHAGGRWGFDGDPRLGVRPGSDFSGRGATDTEAFDAAVASARQALGPVTP